MRRQKNERSHRTLPRSGWYCLFLLAGLTACTSARPIAAQAALPTSFAPTQTPSNAAATPSATASPIATFSSPLFTTPAPTAVATPALSRAGWKTYVSAKLHIAVDYPPDWSVRQDAANVTFVSPQGVMIQLVPAEANGLSPEDWLNQSLIPNVHCSARANKDGLTVQVCFDTISFTHIANVVVSSSSTTRLLSLIVGRRGDVAVFDAMVDSLRLAA